MLGAIFGDIAGSRYEFKNIHSKDCDIYDRDSHYFTDDTVMTIAVAKAILLWDKAGRPSYERLSDLSAKCMREFGIEYPHRGYGSHFRHWIHDPSMGPYNSCGNGAAMRVSPVGWAARTLGECIAMSRAVTKVTHNHPDGIKGAEATAVQIFLARRGYSLGDLAVHENHHYYPLEHDYDWYFNNYRWSSLCDGTCQPAFMCLYESVSFEDCIRNCISIGGDSDTIAAISGGIAEAVYGMDEKQIRYAKSLLDHKLTAFLDVFYTVYMH